MTKRIFIAVLLALPGIALAVISKQLILGEAVLLIGLVAAFAAPIAWLTTVSRRPVLMIVASTAAVGLLLAANVGLHALGRYIRDIHPRNVTRALAQWEVECRHDPSSGMLEYVRDHYRYEDMPEYQNTEVAIELAAQRERTMEAIRAGIREQEEKEKRRAEAGRGKLVDEAASQSQ